MADEHAHPDQPPELRRQAEDKAGGRCSEIPENLGGLSLEEQRRLLHELRAQQAELAHQNDELRRTLAVQEAIFQGSRDAVFISDAESRFVAVNAAACELTGYSAEELLSMRIPDLHADVDRHAYDTHHDSIMAGGEVLSEAPTLRKDGRKVDTEFNNRRIDVDGKALMHTTARDVSERRRAERALQESRERYQNLARVSPVGIFRTDENGATTYVNPAWCRLSGLSVEEALGDGWLSAVHPDDREVLIRGWREASGRARASFSDYRLVRADGTVVWVMGQAIPETNLENQVVGYIGTITDITERKRAEEALRESEERYRQLVEMESDALLLIDNEDGRILEANGAAATLYGFTREELLARKNTDLSAQPEETQRVTLGTPVISDLVVTIPLRIHRKKDGTEFPVEVTGRFFVSHGRPVHIAAIRDITERKRAEDALERSRAQLLQAQKMEAVGRLAGGVAHDFNNILQAMLSLATVLRLKAGSPELARIVAEIEALIKRGAGLTQQLLLYSRRQVAEKKRVDLGELAGAVGVLLRRLVPENIRLTVEAVPGHLWVDGDAGQLQQVLMNLVVNAKDAMPSGGTLTVRADRVDGDAVLAVIDTGHGMDEETRSHLFEPFFTTKDVGTGLGLSVVHGIAEQHRGRVEVESSPGQGSVFRVILPAMPPPDAAAQESSGDAEPPAGHGERVLIVEDEEGARKGLTELLTIFGYVVTAVASGEEAGVLPDTPAPDLLLTDLMLPGIDGAALAAGLRDRWPHLRIILMSGYTEDEVVRRGVDEGEVRFLQKPFDMATLAHALQAALAGAARENGARA